MHQEYTKDSGAKSYGIRSGEPKRPESLIEMPDMTPEVPEVSLCFNQEKNIPPQSNKVSSFEIDGNVLDYRNKKHQLSETLHRNKYESYNTWKAKNAQALYNITGGVERVENGSKHVFSTKRPAGLVRKQVSGREIYSPPVVAAKYPINVASEQVSSTPKNDSGAEYSRRLDDNYGHVQISTTNQPGNSRQVEHQQVGCALHKHPFTKMVSDKTNHNGTPIFYVPNYCNKLQCSCEKNVPINPVNGHQFANEKPPLTKEARANDVQLIDTNMFYGPLDAGLISNHLSSLFHVINIQKEQISVLCQEVSAQKGLMSALLEEIKQIRSDLSLSKQLYRDMSPTKKKSCQNCSCEDKDGHGIRNDKSEESIKSQVKLSGNSVSKHPSDSIEKRSVGVMTSYLENTVNTQMPSNQKDKSHTAKDNVVKAKKQHRNQKVLNSPPNRNKQTNKRELTQREEKRKSQSNQTQRRRNKREESSESSQSDNSFSLDEAAVLTRTEPEQGDLSPDVSIHVSMPDNSSSSTESDTSDSSDIEDEGQESGTEGSDSQIGWTFYDRVVGQVNNMLKKTPKDTRQEYGHVQRKDPGNMHFLYQGDYETENNWSKRVTFDGPPLEDSDNNRMHMPRYHNFRTGQDYRVPGGPERMQDFLMCDYANGGNNLSLVNGSTNVSFATYRYYQRHQLLAPPPPPPGVRVPDQVFPDYHQMKKKKSSPRKSEKTPPMSQKSHKRRSGGPPSKILDMSALKHQPKLF